MAKTELEYNMMKGIIERVFFSSIGGATPLSSEEYLLFSNLTMQQVMTMQDLAILCKKYEDAYNKSSSKFHWSLNHARQYRDLRDEFVKRLQKFNKNKARINASSTFIRPAIIMSSQEKTALTLQTNHINSLRNCSTKKNSCKWIHLGETIEVNGQLLTKGLFYIGEYFKIPQSYRQISKFEIMNRQYCDYNRNYRLLKIYGPILQKDLPISKGNLQIIPFSSYSDMDPTHRYEYLEWLAEKKTVSEISSETFLFYLYGLQLRMFIDESTTEQDRLDVIKHSTVLYSQLQENSICCQELVRFIDAAISKYFSDKLVELVPNDLLPQLVLSRNALIFNAFKYNKDKSKEEIISHISPSIISILNHDNTIPKDLLTDNFYRKYANLVRQDIENRLAYIRNFGKEYRYEIYCMGLNNNYSKFNYDYIFSFILTPKSNDVVSVYYRFAACFKEIAKQLKEYNLLHPVSPTLALFMLPPLFSISEYDEASCFRNILIERANKQEFATMEVNELLRFGTTPQKEFPKISKTQFALIVKSLGKIGYNLVPNVLFNEEPLVWGSNCIIYQETSQNDNEQIEGIDIYIPIIKVAAFLMETNVTSSSMKIADDFINLNIRSEITARHLKAYLRWKLLKPELTPNDYKNIKRVDPSMKDALTAFLTHLSCSDGRFNSQKQERLAKILSLMDINPQIMHSLIHRISTDEDEFVTIEKVSDAQEYSIKDANVNNQPIILSEEQLAKVEMQTKQAQEILSDIFIDEEEMAVSNNNNDNNIVSILKTLLNKDCWLRSEVDSLCKEFNMMTGSVLEQINDYSYNKIEDAVIEDDGDTINVMTEYKDKLL